MVSSGPGDTHSDAILCIVDHLPDPRRTGREARQLELVGALAATGAAVTVWAEHGGDSGASAEDRESLDVQWEAPPPDHRWSPGAAVSLSTQLENLLSRPWELVVVAGPRHTVAVSRILRRRSHQIPVVTDLAGVRFPAAHTRTGTIDRDDPTYKQLLTAVSGADGVITVSGPDAGVLEAAQPGRPVFTFHALGSGFAPETPTSSPGGGLLYVGDLLHHPNLQSVEWWIEGLAARVHARAGRPVPLRVVGRGSDAYRRLWNRPGRVEVAGWQPNIHTEYAAARLMVVPLPYATGTGGRIAAALAAGTPVVASASAARVLDPELQGLVSTGEDADELVDHIARLMSDDEAWVEARRKIQTVDFTAHREARLDRLTDWVAAARPLASSGRISSRRFGSRTTRRPQIRAS